MWLRFVALMSRIQDLFTRGHREREVDDEIEAHLELLTAEHIRRGMTPSEARRLAQAKFGGVTQLKESLREQAGFPALDSIVQDVRYALRTLARSPRFAVAAVLTLALGIGANATLFSVVNAVLLQPLPYRDPAALVWIQQDDPSRPESPETANPITQAWQQQAQSLSVCAFRPRSLIATRAGEPERIPAAEVTANFFALLGGPMEQGRAFTDAEAAEGRAVAIISHGAWLRRFGGAPDILGTRLTLNAQPHTIIGVTRERFRYPGSTQPDVFLPLVDYSPSSPMFFVDVVGRLRSGTQIEAAEEELLGIQTRTPTPLRESPTARVDLTALHETLVGDLRGRLLLLFGVVSLVLLVACANVANLLLARGHARWNELAVRVALGAGRGRLVRMLVIESVLVASAGAGVGVLLAIGTLPIAQAFLPEGIAYWGSLSIDAWVLAFAAGLAVVVGVVCGVLSSMCLPRHLLLPLTKGARPGAAATGSGTRVRYALLVSEVALTFVLVTGAGLLLQSLWQLTTKDAGFDRESLLTFRLARRADRAANVEFFAELEESLTRLPGVVSVGATSSRPFGGHVMGTTEVTVGGEPSSVPGTVRRMYGSWSAAPDAAIPIDAVTPGYFQTVRTRFVDGRDFSVTDTANTPPVAIVNQAFVRRFREGQARVGRTVEMMADQRATIVGIVEDVPDRTLREDPEPIIFRPYAQTVVGPLGFAGLDLMIRTGGEDPLSLADGVRREIRALNRTSPIDNMASMAEVVDASLIVERQGALVLGLFGGLALCLASIGVYGIASDGVVRRTHEIGIRLALGSSRPRILGLVVGQVLVPTVIGIGLGLIAAFGVTRLLGAMLYGVSAIDAMTFVGAAALLTATSIGAAYLPARRATCVDPAEALRAE